MCIEMSNELASAVYWLSSAEKTGGGEGCLGYCMLGRGDRVGTVGCGLRWWDGFGWGWLGAWYEVYVITQQVCVCASMGGR